jgi:glycerol-3-phosphate O-acyltransferase / dihydroxyacetone phosphate acyltransferase
MTTIHTWIRRLTWSVVRLLAGLYFSRIEPFHPERVPPGGPVLLVANHPGSLTDAFLLGTTVSRPVSFVGTVQLFRWRPVGWLFRVCGIIPVNRVTDNPRAMRTLAETFEACHRVLEGGGAIGIFPEGITYNDGHLRPLKSGAARMALEFAHRHRGRIELSVVPVGLTYSRKEHYRSDVLVHFGEPIPMGPHLDGYETSRKERIQALSREIEERIQGLILHLPALDRARLVRSVARLYLDRLKVAGRVVTEALTPRAEELVLTQGIARVIDHYAGTDPDRVRSFVNRLARYERRLARLRLDDGVVDQLSRSGQFAVGEIGRTLMALVALPAAVYGWVHRWAPALLVRWAVRRFTARGARKAQTPHVSMLAGLMGFGLAYALYIGTVQAVWGWPVSLWYGLSLPVSGWIAHAYPGLLRRLPIGLRTWIIRVRAPFAAKDLVRRRQELVNEIEAGRVDYERNGVRS